MKKKIKQRKKERKKERKEEKEEKEIKYKYNIIHSKLDISGKFSFALEGCDGCTTGSDCFDSVFDS